MGLGDDIMATGVAMKLYHGEPVTIGRSKARPYLSPMFENIPWVNTVGAQHLLRSYPGHRDYVTECTRAQQSLDAGYRATAGVLEFTDEEIQAGDNLMDARPAVILEPHIKGTFSGGNKRWSWHYWEELVRGLTKYGYRIVQVSKPGTDSLPGIEFRVCEDNVRVALSCLRWADPVVTADGLLHHAAAALGVPAVVLWGSRVDPKILGYDEHKNLSTGPPYCGSMRDGCSHCRESMLKITPEQVLEAIGRGY